MNPSIVTLGIIPKNLANFFTKYDIKSKRFSNIKILRDHILTHRIDVCFLTNSNIKKNDQISRLIEDNPEIVFIIASDTPPADLNKNVYYINTNEMDNQSATLHFLHNLITYVNNMHQKEELTAMILHDTRSPITSMIGYLELLENGIFGGLNPGQSQILSNIMLLGDMVIELIEDLNLIYQLEQKKLNLKKSSFDLIQILEEVLVTLWIQADKKDIQIHKHVEQNITKVVGDSGKIQRVLMNLITNAIKFSPPKSTVGIELKLVPNSHVIVKISDNGPGIDEKLKRKIFNKHYQNKNMRQKDKGFGLGLYISKNIIEAHGGNISVTNNKTGGCTFSFTLPVRMNVNKSSAVLKT